MRRLSLILGFLLAVLLVGPLTAQVGEAPPQVDPRIYDIVTAPSAERLEADVRALAGHLGLDNAQKPQAACLSSRFPYGSHITEERLEQVERAENVLAELGFTQYRVRHHEEVARLELLETEMAKALALAATIEARIKACGYRFVAVDLKGFESGSLNQGVIRLKRVGN